MFGPGLTLKQPYAGSLGALNSVYSGAGQIAAGNPLQGSLNVASGIPFAQQAFPQTFNPAAYQNPAAQQAIQYINGIGQFAGVGAAGYSLYGNAQAGNYLGAAGAGQRLTQLAQAGGYVPDFGQFIGQQTGIPQVTYQGVNGQAVNGYAPYLTAPLAAAGAVENLSQGNYIGAAANASQAYSAGEALYNSFFPQVTKQAAASAGRSTAASSAGNAANSAAASGAGSATAGSSAASIAGSAAAYLAAAYGIYNIGQGIANSGDLKTSDTARSTATGAVQGAGVGASLGSVIPGAGTAVGAGVGAAIGGTIGLISGVTASGKGEYQRIRDQYRKSVAGNANIPLFGEDFKGQLADGTEFDFGKDGSTLSLDFKNEQVKRGAQLGDILASAQGATGKARVALATLFAGAASSNAKTNEDVDKNMQFFAKKLGIDRGVAQAQLNKLKIDDKLSDAQYTYYSSIVKDSPLDPGADKNVRQLSNDEIKQIREMQKNDGKSTAPGDPTRVPSGTLTDLPKIDQKVGGPGDFGIDVPEGTKVPLIAAGKEYWEEWARNNYQPPGFSGGSGKIPSIPVASYNPAQAASRKIMEGLVSATPTKLTADEIRAVFADSSRTMTRTPGIGLDGRPIQPSNFAGNR